MSSKFILSTFFTKKFVKIVFHKEQGSFSPLSPLCSFCNLRLIGIPQSFKIQFHTSHEDRKRKKKSKSKSGKTQSRKIII